MFIRTKTTLSFIAFIIAAIIVGNQFASVEKDSHYAGTVKVVEVGGYNIHHLADDGICGATQFIGDYIDYEGFGGLKVHCDRTKVEYTMYSNSDSFKTGKVIIKSENNEEISVELGGIRKNETRCFDIRDIGSAGLYTLTLMSGKENKEPVTIWLYYDGNKVQTCRYNTQRQEDIDAWNELIGNLDPETCLEMYMGNARNLITYPTSGQNGNCNHVDEWCAKADEIILKDDWSDELKVFAFVCWMSRNLAYDDYRAHTLKNVSRATKKGVWNDDSLWTYGNNVGQCWDFANILTIMCRHHGIPCTSVENIGHTVNAVWLRDEWVAIDVSVLVSRHCVKEDTNEAGWIKQRDGSYRRDYGYFDPAMRSYNQAIATPETTLSNRSGKNPL